MTVRNTGLSAYNSIRIMAIYQIPFLNFNLFTLVLEILIKLAYSDVFTCLKDIYSL